jgi:trimethylamine--corrinoid protein Co-methyltransferase
LCTSYEKFVLDCEVLQSVVQLMDPIEVNPDTLALDEIAEVGPGGHFFGTERTLSTVETAFYRPLISTTQNYGAWMEAGGRDAAQRASLIWQEALNTYETPHLDPTIGEALAAFVAKRRADGGAPLD